MKSFYIPWLQTSTKIRAELFKQLTVDFVTEIPLRSSDLLDWDRTVRLCIRDLKELTCRDQHQDVPSRRHHTLEIEGRIVYVKSFYDMKYIFDSLFR